MTEDEIANRIGERDICFDEIGLLALYILYRKVDPSSPICKALGEIRLLFKGKIRDYASLSQV